MNARAKAIPPVESLREFYGGSWGSRQVLAYGRLVYSMTEIPKDGYQFK